MVHGVSVNYQVGVNLEICTESKSTSLLTCYSKYLVATTEPARCLLLRYQIDPDAALPLLAVFVKLTTRLIHL